MYGNTDNVTITVNPTATVNSNQQPAYCAGVQLLQWQIYQDLLAEQRLSGQIVITAIGIAASGSGDIPAFTTTNPTNSTDHCNYHCNAGSKWMYRNTATFTITVNPTAIVNLISNQSLLCRSSCTDNKFIGAG
jgi:hypothetical protein